MRFHGAFGDIVYKQFPTGTKYAARKGIPTGAPSAAQVANRGNFGQAVIYGKTVPAENKALYAAKNKETGTPVFALMVADFLHAPAVDTVDLSAFTGKIGEVIRILAHDDFKVKSVQVQIRDTGGTVLEQGAAVLGPDGAWAYTATTNLTLNQHVAIEVTATDLPGNKGAKSQQT